MIQILYLNKSAEYYWRKYSSIFIHHGPFILFMLIAPWCICFIDLNSPWPRMAALLFISLSVWIFIWLTNWYSTFLSCIFQYHNENMIGQCKFMAHNSGLLGKKSSKNHHMAALTVPGCLANRVALQMVVIYKLASTVE